MDEAKDKSGARNPKPGKQNKAERLAEALRENLRKRKAQTHARRSGAAIGATVGGGRPKNDSDTGETR